MEYQNNTDLLKRITLFLLLIGVPVLVLIVLFNYSFVEVTVVGSGNGDISYLLTHQKDEKQTSKQTTEKTFKKLVSRSSHEVLVKQGDQSYFEVVPARGFFTTEKVTAKLVNEKARSFVGNNPNPCMNFTGSVLVSYSCQTTLDRAFVHAPATPTSATYTRMNDKGPDSEIIGMTETNSGLTALLLTPDAGDGVLEPYVAVTLDSNLAVQQSVTLKNLTTDADHGMVRYKEGFLVYNETFTQNLYYSSVNAQPVEIKITPPKNADLKPRSVSAYGDTLAFVYSNSVADEDSHGSTDSKIKNEIVVVRGDKASQYAYARPQEVTVCSEATLCLLGNNKLIVSDISGKKAKEIFSVSDVQEIQPIGQDRIAITRAGEVLNLSLKDKNGGSDLDLAGYTPCGMIPANANSYVVCVINSSNDKSALLITPASNDTTEIDKKLAELRKMPEIKALSPYGQFIYITPNLGEIQYIPSLGGYGYNPTTKKIVSDKINQKVDQLGINRSTFTIVNTTD